MIRITIELISARGRKYDRILGVGHIRLEAVRGAAGDYSADFSKAGRHTDRIWRSARVKNFLRKRYGGWDLLYQALHASVGDRQSTKL